MNKPVSFLLGVVAGVAAIGALAFYIDEHFNIGSDTDDADEISVDDDKETNEAE